MRRFWHSGAVSEAPASFSPRVCSGLTSGAFGRRHWLPSRPQSAFPFAAVSGQPGHTWPRVWARDTGHGVCEVLYTGTWPGICVWGGGGAGRAPLLARFVSKSVMNSVISWTVISGGQTSVIPRHPAIPDTVRGRVSSAAERVTTRLKA